MTVLHCFHIWRHKFLASWKCITFWGALRTLWKAFPFAFPICLFMKQLPYCMIPMYITNNVDEKKRERLTGLFSQVKWPKPCIALLWTNLSFQETIPTYHFLLSWLISITNCIHLIFRPIWWQFKWMKKYSFQKGGIYVSYSDKIWEKCTFTFFKPPLDVTPYSWLANCPQTASHLMLQFGDKVKTGKHAFCPIWWIWQNFNFHKGAHLQRGNEDWVFCELALSFWRHNSIEFEKNYIHCCVVSEISEGAVRAR